MAFIDDAKEVIAHYFNNQNHSKEERLADILNHVDGLLKRSYKNGLEKGRQQVARRQFAKKQ